MAESVALRILGGASQSASGLQRRLEGRGFSPPAAASAVARCRAAGYVNDQLLAASVASRHRRSGHGRGRVAADLRSRGVDGDTISAILDGMSATEEPAALAEAQRLWDRAATRGDVDRAARMRVAAALQRRGYSGEIVMRVMRGIA